MTQTEHTYPATPRGRAREFGAWFAGNHPELTATEIGRIYFRDTGGRIKPSLVRNVVESAREQRR